MELKNIGVLSLARIAGLFGVIYGFITGILIVLLINKSPEIATQLGVANVWGNWAIIILPAINGVAYFVAGALLALIYNLLTRLTGGIKFDFAEKKK